VTTTWRDEATHSGEGDGYLWHSEGGEGGGGGGSDEEAWRVEHGGQERRGKPAPVSVSAMKGCLKQSRAPSPAAHTPPKHVAFGSERTLEVYLADEWDRTPAEPARHLSHQSVSPAPTTSFADSLCRDILELEEMQRSLPCAEQPAALITPSATRLSAVPIGLLPLLPTPDPSPAPKPPPVPPQSRTYPTRKNPRFTFLPLLPRSPSPSPPPSPRCSSPDTPTLTRDSSPRSTASSSSPEPSFLQLPPSCAHGRFCAPSKRPGFGAATSPFPTAPPPTPTPKNVIVINGIEIDLDDDRDPAEAPSIPTTPTQTSSSPPALQTFLSSA